MVQTTDTLQLLKMDETPVQVLKEPGKIAQFKSYMWLMKGGPRS